MQPSPPNPRASWPSHDDHTGFLVIVIGVALAAFSYLLWNTYHSAISQAVMAIHQREIALVHRFTTRFDLAARQMGRADPALVSLRDLYDIGHDVGLALRVPACALIAFLAALCPVRASPSRFRRAFDLDGLFREQTGRFPATAAFVRRHLRLLPPDADHPRPADYALTGDEWVARFATMRSGTFDESAARRALAGQLGPLWSGVGRASPQVRLMVAVFALHLGERREEAIELLGHVSLGLADRAADDPAGPAEPLLLPDAATAAADAVLADGRLVPPALACMNRHAYTHPALMTLLNEARIRAGVLAPGQFAWLKLVDRGLWYALHSLGFETEGFGRYLHPNPRVEAAGVRDHWAAERIVGELIEPDIDRALDAVRKLAAARAARPAKRV